MAQELGSGLGNEWDPVRAWVEDGLRSFLDEAWEVETNTEGSTIKIKARLGKLATAEAVFNTETGLLKDIKITYRVGRRVTTRTHEPVRIGKSPTTLMDVGLTIAELVLGKPH
jgi:hypothetical protein